MHYSFRIKSGNQAIDNIAEAIQLAVTPVFLLAGLSGILNVVASRLSRIIDQARVLQARLFEGSATDETEIEAELRMLNIRMRIVNFSIFLSTMAALLICTVVAIIFSGSLVHIELGALIAGSFIASMSCLILALLAFLVEVYFATLRYSIRR